jgi:hypothetical protein
MIKYHKSKFSDPITAKEVIQERYTEYSIEGKGGIVLEEWSEYITIKNKGEC